jgi:hypothetical protein
MLALFTFRPDFSPPWTGRSHLTQVTVSRLPRRQAVEVIGQVAHGKALPPAVIEQVVTKTDGVPLFVEELTKMVLESGLLQEREERYELTGPLPPLAIPATLHDSLMARLDRLATAKGLVQQTHDAALAVLAHASLGTTWLQRGALPVARQHLEDGIARDTPALPRTAVFRLGRDPGMACRGYAAVTLWLLGYPDQALTHLHEALALAQALSHLYSLAFARLLAAFVTQFRRDVPAVHSFGGGLGLGLGGGGVGVLGPARGGDSPDRPGDRCLSGHRGSSVRALLLHRARGRLCPPGPHGRQPPGTGRGPHLDRAA